MSNYSTNSNCCCSTKHGYEIIKQLEEHAKPVELFWSRFHESRPSDGARYELGFLGDSLADFTRTIMGGVRGAMASGDEETIRRVRLAVERCQNEVRQILSQGASDQAARSEDVVRPGGQQGDEYDTV